MKTINEEYQEIISKCKFISKKDEWFIEGCECENVDKCSYSDYKQGQKFNDGWCLFHGLIHDGVEDGETCPFDEFLIYDEHGNEISELTLEEYKKLIA